MAKPLAHGLSKCFGLLELQTMDEGELEQVEIAFAAVIYERMGEFTALSLLYLTLAGVAAPRVAEYMERRSTGLAKLGKTSTHIPQSAVQEAGEALQTLNRIG